MLNPVISPEAHTSESFQYEYNLLEGAKCAKARLVKRYDHVNVRFMSVHGNGPDQRHHVILPFRESRLVQ